MELLLALIRGTPIDPMAEDSDWLALFSLAEEQQLAPFIAAQVRRADMQLSSRVETKLQKIERESVLSTFFWCAELRGLLRAFDNAGIRLLPLKGPFLAQRVYGQESLRTSRDLDLLVRKADLPAAETLLHSLGFLPTGPGDDYHRPWLRNTAGVELHFDVENPLAFGFSIADAWRQAEPTTFAGERCWKLAPQHELLFLALHAMRHRFDKLSLVLDLALTIKRYAPCSLAVPGEERPPRLQAVLDLGAALAYKLHSETTMLLPQSAPHIARLAEQIWRRLQNEPPVAIDWQTRHRFYLEVEPSFLARIGTRLRHVRILLSRLIASDYDFAARLGYTRRWQVRLLRPVRLVAVQLARPHRQWLGSLRGPV